MKTDEGPDNNEDLEEGELLDDDGEVDYSQEKKSPEEEEPLPTVVYAEPPPAPAVIPSLLDMKISPPRNGKTFLHDEIQFICNECLGKC